MPVYQIQTPCVFDIEAMTEQEAKDQLIRSLYSQDEDEYYGGERCYVPCTPEFMDVIDVELDQEED